MRVAINVEQLLQPAPGGIGRYTDRLLTLLPRLFPDDAWVPFCARHPPAAVRAAVDPAAGDTVVLPLPRPLLYDAWHLLGIPRLAWCSTRLRGLDAVHAPSLAVPAVGDTPLVATVHDHFPAQFPETYPGRGRWFHRRGLAAAGRRARLVICPSEAVAADVRAAGGFDPGRIRVVPMGCDMSAPAEDVTAGALSRLGVGERPYVLWTGTLEPRKNVPLLLDAFAAARREAGLPHRLVLTGVAGWAASGVEERLGALEASGDVRRLGRVGEDDLAALYAGAGVFVLPSLAEGFGLPVLEAMACGTPVVCSDTGSLPEVAGDAARLLAPRDPEAWAAAIVAVLSDPAERIRMARRGRERAAAFTWEACVRATRDVYADAASGG